MMEDPDISRVAALIGDPARASILEAVMRGQALRRARVCHNHLAGERGVQLYDSLVARGHLVTAAVGLTPSPEGWDFASDFGIPPEEFTGTRPPQCRECLDRSVRRSRLGGRLGRACLAEVEAKRWARRIAGSRVIAFPPEGGRAIARAFP